MSVLRGDISAPVPRADVVAEADAIARSIGGNPCEFSPMDHAFDPVGNLGDTAERKQLADSPTQPLPHHDDFGERLEGQRQPGFPLPCVELEENARDAWSDPNDLRNAFEGPPGELREGAEPEAGEEWVVGAGAAVQVVGRRPAERLRTAARSSAYVRDGRLRACRRRAAAASRPPIPLLTKLLTHD
ncbi:hypothetical protein [Streptomyces sp. NPDC019539]|uniref:hypothetical protein n=1 Tax=Streptomyces sp. NPDC019539 TaxID=3365063 RepID=UPI0037A0CAD4